MPLGREIAIEIDYYLGFEHIVREVMHMLDVTMDTKFTALPSSLWALGTCEYYHCRRKTSPGADIDVLLPLGSA